MVKVRRKELRDMAKSRIEAIERKAITEIEISCLGAQEQIAIAGLSSDAARQFIEKLPSLDSAFLVFWKLQPSFFFKLFHTFKRNRPTVCGGWIPLVFVTQGWPVTGID